VIATETASAVRSRPDEAEALRGPVAILMPVHDGEPGALARTLETLREHAESFGGVVVFLVDDGSGDAVRLRNLPAQTAAFRIVLARHVVNLGQGAALETARQLALAQPVAFTAYVTMDADGQHLQADARALARAVEEGADVAFGNRFLGDSNIPTGRHAVLVLARWFERVITGLRLADAHNGLRGFSRAALERVPIRQNRMAHATEIKLRVSRASMRVVEVPVSVRYTRETLARGQRNLSGAIILRDLMLQYLFGE
jgi:glycosyltransferase involved in cell wall biosynthesis